MALRTNRSIPNSGYPIPGTQFWGLIPAIAPVIKCLSEPLPQLRGKMSGQNEGRV
jgi:hypothetical protein